MSDDKKFMNGKFGSMLKRNNKQLREDRGARIISATEKYYRRTIEDMEEKIANLKMDRENLLDINPSNTQTIINPSDFDSNAFVQKDIEIGKTIYNMEKVLEITRERYNDLFDVKAEG